MRFCLVSLGCPKNEVISDNLAQLLVEAGHRVVLHPTEADLLLVNTCGFIAPAREESLEVLRELAAQKRSGQKLVAVGCLAQLAGRDMLSWVPGLDGLLGTRRWAEVGELLERLEEAGPKGRPVMVDDGRPEAHVGVQQHILRGRPSASAYLSISEGCNAACAFCTIPRIKGLLRSRPVSAVVREARFLVERGARELVIVAQDTTAYGQDRGERDGLPNLLREILRAVPELSWLRLMYAYPQHITRELVEVMAEDPRICHYLDIPLQHAHPEVLRRMRRPYDVARMESVLESLRLAMPDIALRTSLIVGYPGETEAEFSALLDFVERAAFDKVGVFTYSREPGTAAHDLDGQVPEAVKEERYHRLMALQQRISLARNREQVGRTLEVLVEGAADGISVGRSYRDAPEIDGLVIFEGEASTAEFVSVRVTGAAEYDLTGVWVRRQSRN